MNRIVISAQAYAMVQLRTLGKGGHIQSGAVKLADGSEAYVIEVDAEVLRTLLKIDDDLSAAILKACALS